MTLGFDSAALALIAAMTTPPSAARAALINSTIVALKAAGIWALLDVLYVLAAADSQAARLNWKNPGTFTLTAVNSPTFTADRGFAGNGTTSYLDTGWNPTTDAAQFTQDAAHIAAWDRTARAADTTALIGAVDAERCEIYPRFLGDIIFTRVNDAGNALVSTDSSGMFLGNRAASGSRETWRNGVLMGSVAAISTAPPNLPVYLCGENLFGSLGVGTTDQISFASMGGDLAGKEAAYYTALQAYMTAVGA